MGSSRTVLVTGGAGYVGAHACLALAEAGWLPVTYDDLSNGHRAAVRWGPLEVGDIRDEARLADAMARHRPAAVFHFAALIDVAESVRAPDRYRSVNVDGARKVIAATRAAGIARFILSSSCAVYGAPERLPMDEGHATRPVNPYGAAKLAAEEMLRAESGLAHVALRYFNAAGADPDGRIGEAHRHETHAIPLALAAAAGGPAFTVHGTDYATRDGTAERDYVHVTDLADAHVRALDHLLGGGAGGAINLGTGRGTTVRELLAAVARETARPVSYSDATRRPGDPAALICDPARAAEMLGWRARHGLAEIVRTAARWHDRNGMTAPGNSP